MLLVSYRPLAPCRLCIVFLQAFSYHFNHSAGSATPCAVLVSWPSAAADAQPLGRAPPDPLLSAKRVPRGIRHKNTETGAQCAAPRCALAI
jgi:hypothetical protein